MWYVAPNKSLVERKCRSDRQFTKPATSNSANNWKNNLKKLNKQLKNRAFKMKLISLNSSNISHMKNFI